MDNTNLDLYKKRSYRSILAAGLLLYAANWQKFFKASWIATTLYSLTAGIAIHTGNKYALAVAAVLLVLGILCIWGKLKEHSVSGSISNPPTWFTVNVLNKKNMAAVSNSRQQPPIHYAFGRHIGIILAVTFTSMLLLCLASIIILLPLIVIKTASIVAYHSQLIGDASGMPAYMPYLSVATNAACMFVHFYILIISLMHCHYLFGSISSTDK